MSVTHRMAKGAAVRGDVKFMKWLHLEWGVPVGGMTIKTAVRNGHLSLVRWLLNQGCEYADFDFIDAAASGNVELMRWLYDEWEIEKITKLFYDAINIATRRGHFPAVQWLLSMLNKVRPWLADYADQLRWQAAFSGNLELLQWVYQLPQPQQQRDWDFRDLNLSLDIAQQTVLHLPILLWLREHGAPCDIRTTTALAQRGAIDALMACVDAGYPLSLSDASAKARKAGHRHVVRWLGDYAYRLLPDEMLQAVLSHLHPKHLAMAALVCRRWRVCAKTCPKYGMPPPPATKTICFACGMNLDHGDGRGSTYPPWGWMCGDCMKAEFWG